MDTADPHHAEDALAALLHRVASPLGAIANYAYLVPAADAPEARQGILEAIAGLRGTLQCAQRWLDALATTREAVPAGGVDLAVLLRAGAGRREEPVGVEVPDLPHVPLPPAAAERLVEALLSAATDVRADLAPEEGVYVVVVQSGRTWSEAEAAGAFDLFPPWDSESNDAQSELALAGSLARRFGGRTWGAVGPAGEAVVHLVLPTEPPQAAGHDEERQDA